MTKTDQINTQEVIDSLYLDESSLCEILNEEEKLREVIITIEKGIQQLVEQKKKAKALKTLNEVRAFREAVRNQQSSSRKRKLDEFETPVGSSSSEDNSDFGLSYAPKAQTKEPRQSKI